MKSLLFDFVLATIVILTAARAGHLIDALFHKEMENSSALVRYNSILKFQTLWRFRYQFWIRLEEGAHSMMKVKMTQKNIQNKNIFLFRFLHQVLNSSYHPPHLV